MGKYKKERHESKFQLHWPDFLLSGPHPLYIAMGNVSFQGTLPTICFACEFLAVTEDNSIKVEGENGQHNGTEKESFFSHRFPEWMPVSSITLT